MEKIAKPATTVKKGYNHLFKLGDKESSFEVLDIKENNIKAAEAKTYTAIE